MAVIDGELAEMLKRLSKPYNALETGPITLENLAARIRELRTRAHHLERTHLDLVGSRQDAKAAPVDAAVVKGYVEAFKALLSPGAIVAQKASLRSFLKRLEMHLSQVVADYIILFKTPRDSTFGFFWLPLLLSRYGLRKEGEGILAEADFSEANRLESIPGK